MNKKAQAIILDDYKYGKFSLIESLDKLKLIGISEKEGKTILLSIDRYNIFLISDYNVAKTNNGDCLSGTNFEELSKNYDEEYYFDIKFED